MDRCKFETLQLGGEHRGIAVPTNSWDHPIRGVSFKFFIRAIDVFFQ